LFSNNNKRIIFQGIVKYIMVLWKTKNNF